jgi:hypothetical protein
MDILFLVSIFLVIYSGHAARLFVIGNRLTGGKNRADRLPAIARAIRLGSLGYAALYLVYFFFMFIHH